MTVRLDSRVTSEINWGWTDRDSNVQTTSNGILKQQTAFASDATPAIDTVWCAQNATLAASGSCTYDLTALSREVFGISDTVELAAVCVIHVYNRSEDAILQLENTGTGTPENPEDGSFLRAILPPGSVLTLCNPQASWDVTTVRKKLMLTNLDSTHGAAYDIAVTGIAASDSDE